MTGLQVAEVVMMIVLYDIFKTVLRAIFDFIEDGEKHGKVMTYGYCVYHGIECNYPGPCRDCPHNTEKDTEWFKQNEEQAESEDI